jgi:3-hydroxyacyl-[acyl-carrier-protein] dehydratase
MPPKYIFDIAGIDLATVLHDQDAIREVNPQRGQMEHLNGIIYADREHARILGYKDVQANEFWVEGHIPGRPLLPGVIMVEAGAQLASFYTKKYLQWEGFIGFGGVENCKFRMSVEPGVRMYLLGVLRWQRHRRIGCAVQGIVNGQLAFEADIIGVQM